MQHQFDLEYFQYKDGTGNGYRSMSKNIWDDLITEERNLVIPRELMLKRKELGLNNQEYILLLDYLYCLNQGEIEGLNQWLSELNGVSEATIERRLNSVKKKGLLRQEVRTDENGRIKGMIFNPEPLAKKLKSLISNDECEKKIRTVCESNTDYGVQNEAREKNWKDDFCSTRWYNDVFPEMYEEAAGQPVLTGGREFKSAEAYFRRLRQLNPNIDAKALFVRATEGARYMLDSQLRGGVFGWLHKPPDICMLANQTQAVDYHLRCLEKIYGQQESINEESDQCNVEVLFKENVEEKKNEQIERLYGELREIEQGGLRRDFQESLQKRLSRDKS
jgi:hypothetical protein